MIKDNIVEDREVTKTRFLNKLNREIVNVVHMATKIWFIWLPT
jgi:hypothetical protein